MAMSTKRTYRNLVEYTTDAPAGLNARPSNTVKIYSQRPLTIIGAQRKIRKDFPGAVVTAVQATEESGGSW